MQTIQMRLSRKENIFFEFFSAFFESALKFEHFQKNITIIVYVFRKLPTIEDALR